MTSDRMEAHSSRVVSYSQLFKPSDSQEEIHVDLNQKLHPKEQNFFSERGQNVKTLILSCHRDIQERQSVLGNILKLCSNVQKLKLQFKGFVHEDTLSSDDIFKFAAPLKNLTSFEFISIIDIRNVNELSGCIFGDALDFYYRMFVQIVNATECLQILNLSTNRLADYLDELTGNMDVSDQLSKLHTLRLHNHMVTREQDKDMTLEFDVAFMDFLPLSCSTLVNLHICGATWTDLECYPTMPLLDTLSIQWNCESLYMNITRECLPNLNTLILCELSLTKPVYLNFQWPFVDKPKEKIGFPELEWLEDVKRYKFDVNYEEPNDLGGIKVCAKYRKPSPLNVVLSLFRDKLVVKKPWIDRVLEDLSEPSLNVKSIFIDLIGTVGNSLKNYVDLREHCIRKFRSGDIPYLKYGVFRALEDKPAEVHTFTL